MTQKILICLLALATGFSGCTSLPHHSAQSESTGSQHTGLADQTQRCPHPTGGLADSSPNPFELNLAKTGSTSAHSPASECDGKVIPVSLTDAALIRKDSDSTDSSGSILALREATDNSDRPPASVPEGYSLSLGNVLQLTDAQNPNVALARERINDAYARSERAKTLWLPSLRAGLNYNRHEGAIQDVAGNVFNTNRSSFYGGLGAGAVGAGSPAVPGVVAQFHLTDAVFQPRIASHQACARRYSATASRNDALRDAAVAYLELVRAEHAWTIAADTLANTEKLTSLTQQYAETGQGLNSDYHRLEAERALRQEELVARSEAIQVASVRLAQILHADPAVLIQSNEPDIVPLEIVRLDGGPASYVATGLSRRPELAEQRHLVCAAVERLRREEYAPLVPSVLLGMSYGGLGGGLGNSIINTDERWDADAVAYWEIRNLGFGEHAARNEACSLQRQAQMRKVALMDNVAREVTEAHAQVTRRQERIALTQRGVEAAMKSYSLNLQRIENAQGLPIETLQSIQALAGAQRAYLNAVVDYNIAQFELSRAIGWFADSEATGTGVARNSS